MFVIPWTAGQLNNILKRLMQFQPLARRIVEKCLKQNFNM